MAFPLGRTLEHTVARILLLAGAALLASCAGRGDPGETWGRQALGRVAALEEALAADAREAGEAAGLEVRLAFGGEADLDLYVSDPLQETVYYANTPSGSGGALEVDRRCLHEAPRVERVRFAEPLPGRYRVGVDFPQRCGGRGGRALYVVRIDVDGRSLSRRGWIEPLRFQPIVAEFEVNGSEPLPPRP